MYGTRNIKDLHFNCCHSGLCERPQKKKCDTKRECLLQLCGDDERKIGKVSLFKEYDDKTYKKIDGFWSEEDCVLLYCIYQNINNGIIFKIKELKGGNN